MGTTGTTVRSQKAELIHIEVDRRLGHEWDEWDGKPLPGLGDFSAPPGRFFRYAALSLGVGTVLTLPLLFVLWPRLSDLWAPLPGALLLGVVGFAERGPFLGLMAWTSHVARRFGVRDWVEHAAVEVYNGLAARRGRKVGKGELLVLIPRCLSKATLDGVLDVAGRYEVPVFVATRGQLARRAIRERRPRAVVAVACERDMVTGLHDVAGKIPVLGLTMQLPNGPCRDAAIDLDVMEAWVREWVGTTD